MATGVNSQSVADQARRQYVETWLSALPTVVQSLNQSAFLMLTQVAEPALQMRRREAVDDLKRASDAWLIAIEEQLQAAFHHRPLSAAMRDFAAAGAKPQALSLVDDDTIEGEIVSSRLALAMMDRASWEFTDLRTRINQLEGREELSPTDVLRPHVAARVVTAAWRTASLGHDTWRLLQPLLHAEFAALSEEAYHECNRWLIGQRVMPEVDLRPLIRRSRNAQGGASGAAGMATGLGAFDPPVSSMAPGGGGAGSANAGASRVGSVQGAGGRPTAIGEETRMLTRAGPMVRGADHAEAVLGRLNRLIGRHLPGFAHTDQIDPAPSPALNTAISQAQTGLVQRMRPAEGAATGVSAPMMSMPAVMEELQQRKQALKQAATTPVQRATIEIVALLFQSILTEERIPAAIRVWFARLQMPVLRVAVGEPDFFAATDHPARRLIDRMGSCVMGFDASSDMAGEALEREVKRIVQVVEAYPDTGRRVFQTVLGEFEKFLEHYFRSENEATRKGVSLAQQVEQRETLAIQYTIELRKMLNDMMVQEGVRNFLFQVWADVLAMSAVKQGHQSDETKVLKRAAADLIWSAGAKVSREERTEVIRRLPPLLKILRDGMALAGINVAKQDEHIQALNNALAAAFVAKAAAIPQGRLNELMARLDTLEELLPDAEEIEIDQAMVLDLSGYESTELEVVSEGGSMPTAAMLAWATELQVGSWYMLDYRGRNEQMQLAWQGMRRQLALFVSPQGRGVLFQQQRLAAFLQAGLLLPAQDEALTVRATRSALAKIDADPERLLN